jgi:hypothetical protein
MQKYLPHRLHECDDQNDEKNTEEKLRHGTKGARVRVGVRIGEKS